MSAKTGQEKVKRGIRDITIPQSASDKRYGQALRAQRELEGINEVLTRDGLAGKSLRFEGRDAKEVVAVLSKRRQELRERLHSLGADHPDALIRYARVARAVPRTDRPLIIGSRELTSGISLNHQWLSTLIAQQQAVNCNTIYIGQVRASDFRLYAWNNPDVGGAWGAYAYWPLSQVNQFAQDTYAGDWSGETGAFFWTWVRVPGQWGADPMDSIAGAAVLQFTIPAPQCDATLHWGTWGIAEAVTTWVVDADEGQLNSDWVLHESPDGGGFPGSLTSSFQFIVNGLYKNDDGTTIARDVTPFEGSFAVQAGVSPKIYLGFTLLAQAVNGEASSVKFGVGDNFEFERGVTYIMVSQQA